MIDVYNENSNGMCKLTNTCVYYADFHFQIFEDGATYWGWMKTLARQVVSFHFKNEFYPMIEEDHNSDQRDNIIAGNVKKLIDESLFLQGPPDINVGISFGIISFTYTLKKRAVRKISVILQSSTFSSASTTEVKTRYLPYFPTTLKPSPKLA